MSEAVIFKTGIKVVRMLFFDLHFFKINKITIL